MNATIDITDTRLSAAAAAEGNAESYASFGEGFAAVSAPHPDLEDGRLVHYVELDGEPIRTSQGGIDTYPSRSAAVFAAKTKARRAASV
jgi:hypothetical protein